MSAYQKCTYRTTLLHRQLVISIIFFLSHAQRKIRWEEAELSVTAVAVAVISFRSTHGVCVNVCENNICCQVLEMLTGWRAAALNSMFSCWVAAQIISPDTHMGGRIDDQQPCGATQRTLNRSQIAGGLCCCSLALEYRLLVGVFHVICTHFNWTSLRCGTRPQSTGYSELLLS